ncbi:hemopexin repeat-containing protein [Rhodococcus maanshanensis]|nr:hemopexin repeat-containing protein [Rhodococcus maanshanensis]
MPVDAALYSGSQCYFFNGYQYIRVTRTDTGPGTIDPGYPKNISEWQWGTFGSNGIDAALYSGTKCYFFNGNQYIRVTRTDTGPGTIDPGYPKNISEWQWGTFGSNGIDAALYSGTKCYFFNGNQYIRVTRTDTGPGTIDPGYPKNISEWQWGTFGSNGIDAALYSGTKCYFFNGNQYIRVTRTDTGPGTIDPGYPKNISEWQWGTFGSNGIDTALYSGTKCYFFNGNQYIRVTRTDTGPGTIDPGYPKNISEWQWGTFGRYPKRFVRKNIWILEATTPWDPITLAYANAVKALQARAPSDPRSWTYLAAVHGSSASVPPGAVWNQCQHGSWFFLPWHRMYLYYFERIVRAEVIAQGGPHDWALPFWNYENPGHAALPPAFRDPTMPDGTANPLFVTQRSAGMNMGAQLPQSVTTSAAALAFDAFTPPPAPAFGGGKTGPQHFFGAHGELEFTPHNDVHGMIGGWMGNPNQAALDPIFWLHHSNIDRLWSIWIDQGGGRANPPDTQWRTTPFVLHDETAAQVRSTASAVLDTRSQLRYVYETVGAPAVEAVVEAMSASPPPDPPPEFVGASERPVELAGAPATVDVVIDRRTLESRARELPSDSPAHVYLNLEDIEAERNPDTVYEVFVSGPRASDGTVDTTYYVGNVSFFGIEHLSVAGPASDGPHGIRRTFDITGWIDELRAQGRWDDEQMVVSFRPLSLIMPPGTELPPVVAEESLTARAAPVRIGRVSLFYG